MSGEHARARDAFNRYCRMEGKRSIERLRESMEADGVSPPTMRTLYEWSRRYQWQHRIQAIEREIAAAEQEQRIHEIREMRERQIREGLLLQQQGATWLASIGIDRVSAADATRAIVEGSRLERESRGAGERSDGASPRLDPVSSLLEELTDHQLAAVARAIEEAQRED